MFVAGLVTMVRLNDLIKELTEDSIRVLRASVAADTRVNVLSAREDTSLERNTILISLVMIGIPDFLCEVLAHERLAASGELRPAFKIFWRVEEITAHSAADSSILTHRLFMVIFIIGFVLFIDLRGFFTVILVVLHKFYARINFVNSAQADEECSIDCTELPLGVIIDIDCFDHNVSRDMLVEPPQVCWH